MTQFAILFVASLLLPIISAAPAPQVLDCPGGGGGGGGGGLFGGGGLSLLHLAEEKNANIFVCLILGGGGGSGDCPPIVVPSARARARAVRVLISGHKQKLTRETAPRS